MFVAIAGVLLPPTRRLLLLFVQLQRLLKRLFCLTDGLCELLRHTSPQLHGLDHVFVHLRLEILHALEQLGAVRLDPRAMLVHLLPVVAIYLHILGRELDRLLDLLQPLIMSNTERFAKGVRLSRHP